MTDPKDEQVEIAQVWEKLGGLEARVNESRKGFLGWINKWGVLVGLIATCLSIMGGAISISSSISRLNPKPNTRVFAVEDKSVLRQFDSTKRRLTLKVSFIVTNSGDADDLILIKALLKVPDLAKEDISHSYGGDFEVTDQTGRKLPRPFVLPKSANLELTCSVSFNYSDRSAALFEKEGMRRLSLILENETKAPPALDFCFEEIYTPDSLEFFAQECPKDF